ncbi:MAG: alpha/beta hydrolase [Anaerolineae bacterium]
MRRLFLGLLIVIIGLPVLGLIYQAISVELDMRSYPPPGQMIDVGGYSLHIYCVGEGSPTVIMDSGLGGASLDWALVQPDVAQTTRVCTFDRAGMGWSDVGPNPRDAQQIVGELHTLLTNAQIAPPYVMVGHSNGGLRIQLYAALYPDEVAGLVLVDPTDAHTIDEQLAFLSPEARAEVDELMGQNGNQVAQDPAATFETINLFVPFGVVRLLADTLLNETTPYPYLPPDVQPQYQAVMLRTPYLGAYIAELRGIDASIQQVRDTVTTFGDIPCVILLSTLPATFASRPPADPDFGRVFELMMPTRIGAMEATAALSSNGQVVMAENSGHYIQIDRPDLVIGTIRDMVEGLRGNS